MKILPATLALLATAALSPLATGQIIPDVAPEIVSAWRADGENALLVFRYDGTYHMAQDSAGALGMERGTFIWNKATSAFAVTTIVDTNGDAGLSHPDGATTLTISGAGNNTMTYTVAGEGSFILTRVVNTASAIVGSWFIPGEKFTVTFLADGTYFHTEEANDAPYGYDGMEYGTYTWNSSTKILTATPITDTNGDVGLSSLPAGFTATIVGNAMTVSDDGETTVLRRITQIPSPLNTKNDFEVDKFANYRQTSTSNPTLLAGPVNDDYPFWGEAYIEDSVTGTGGSLTITGQVARPFIDDDGWFVGAEYSSLNALNASSAFPNGATYTFARTGGSAALSYPIGGTFPAAPKIQVGDGTWSAGEYVLGQNQTLTWGAHSGYNPATLVTVLSVVDQETQVELFYEAVIQGDITSYDFSDKLTPGSSYDVQLEHVKIASSTTTGTGPFAGKLGYALYNANTRFTMVAPEAPTYEPVISEHPQSQVPAENSTVTLTAGTINNDPSETFQWFKNNEEIPGQTGNSLRISSFDEIADRGGYTVSVTNESGTTTSDVALLGPSVEYLFIHNGKYFRQESAALGAPSGGTFDARVEGFGISSTFPASSITVTKPDTTTLPLALDGDHWDIETDFPSFAEMRSIFPIGLYKINIGSDIISIELAGNTFPNQPLITSSAGTWVNGKLQLTASEAASPFTVTTNSNTGNGWSRIIITDPFDDDIVDVIANIPENPTEFVDVEIFAGQLSVGQTYEVEARFDNAIERTDAIYTSWASPLSPETKGYELLSTTTLLTIEVVPDPTGSTYATWQSGFFTPTQLADPAISGDDIDFDKDGIPNLLEFLFGGNPTLPNGNLLPAFSKPQGSGTVVFTYQRKLAATGVTQVIEHSTDLSSDWAPAVNGQSGVSIATAPTPGDATSEQVTVTIPSTSPRRFVRLSVSR